MADNFGRPSAEGRRLPVGVHTDVVVNSIEVKVTPNGNKYIDVVLQNKSGSAYQKIWYPKLDEVKPKEGKTLEQAKQWAIDSFTGSIYTLLDALGAGEVSASDADKFADKAITAIVDATSKGAKCTIVLQWDKKGEWPEFPKYNWAYNINTLLDSINLDNLRMKKEDTEAGLTKRPTTNNSTSGGDLF